MDSIVTTLGKFEAHRLQRLARAHEEGAPACCEQRVTDWSFGMEREALVLLGTVEGAGRPIPVVTLVLGANAATGIVTTDEGAFSVEGATSEDLARIEEQAAALRDNLLRKTASSVQARMLEAAGTDLDQRPNLYRKLAE